MDSLVNFHFIRPIWFLALIPLLALIFFLWNKKSNATGLESYINNTFLDHLTLKQQKTSSRLPVIFLFIIWFLVITALAGPTWKKIPQPVHSAQSAVVIILDLSPSMMAEDTKPSRIIRAHLKVQDLLSRRKDGLTALIVYAGEAHIVTPLTDDTRTIANLLPTLVPGILPIPGSNTEMAIKMASDLVTASGLTKASILLITDGVNKNAISSIKQSLNKSLQLTILGIGTNDGAPIPNSGDFLKDADGKTIIAKRNSVAMEALAKSVDGFYLPMQSTAADIDFFYQQLNSQFNKNTVLDNKNRKFDSWYEFAPTLLLIIIPFLALIFRRGLILSVFIVLGSVSLLTPMNAQASVWDYLWKNENQRAAESYSNQEYSEAAEQFKNPKWKGSALYENKDYEDALNEFLKDDSAIGDYNRGNALAQLQRYDDAISAYDEALSKDSTLEAAKKNKQIVEELKKQSKEQEQNQKNQEDNSDSSENNEQQESESQESQESNNQNSESDQQNTDDESQSEDASQQDQTNQDANEQDKQEDLNSKNEKDNENNEENKGQAQQESKLDNNLSPEEQQALEQWLRKVPDDPSGLLKRKFNYEYNKRRRLYQEGKWDLPDNNAHQRY